MKRLVVAVGLIGIIVGASERAAAQQFTDVFCIQVGQPLDITMFVVAQTYPFSVFPGNAFSLVGRATKSSHAPVYGSGFVLQGESDSAAHFALTVGANVALAGTSPTVSLRGFVRFSDGHGNGVCEQNAGDVPCGARSSVAFSFCPVS